MLYVFEGKKCLQGKVVDFIDSTPEILKCAVCATWAESKGLAPFSIFFCKNKNHSSSRAPLSSLKAELEKYIGKLGTTVVDTKIRFSVNYFKKTILWRLLVNDLSWITSLDISSTCTRILSTEDPAELSCIISFRLLTISTGISSFRLDCLI